MISSEWTFSLILVLTCQLLQCRCPRWLLVLLKQCSVFLVKHASPYQPIVLAQSNLGITMAAISSNLEPNGLQHIDLPSYILPIPQRLYLHMHLQIILLYLNERVPIYLLLLEYCTQSLVQLTSTQPSIHILTGP
jgi:hypothetical protein